MTGGAPRLSTRRLEGERPLTGLARQWDREAGAPTSWLDSGQGAPGRARFSVLCQSGPTVLALGRSTRRDDAEPSFAARMREAFERGRSGREAARRAAPGAPFLGGWIGYLAYESQIDMDPAFPGRPGLLPYPRAWFREATRGVTVDHRHAATWLWSWDRLGEEAADFERWEAQLSEAAGDGGVGAQDCGWRVDPGHLDRRWYEEAVRDVLSRIQAGEIYQVNLTSPVPVTAGRDPLGLYLRLRRASPGDFAAYLAWRGLVVLASSPEEFFRLRGRELEARPMKGTRPRGSDRPTDEALRSELAESLKDRAENVMIVDLIRNDLGRVAETGSVSVPSLFEIETYATVHQMTSTVSARLKEGADVFDVLEAVFPPGSMTGTPKVQATRVIRNLEPGPRGLYSGCLGAIDWSGDAVFNVVIRSLVSSRRGASWAVGGGIVADSDSAAEWAEARVKLEALVRALR